MTPEDLTVHPDAGVSLGRARYTTVGLHSKFMSKMSAVSKTSEVTRHNVHAKTGPEADSCLMSTAIGGPKHTCSSQCSPSEEELHIQMLQHAICSCTDNTLFPFSGHTTTNVPTLRGGTPTAHLLHCLCEFWQHLPAFHSDCDLTGSSNG